MFELNRRRFIKALAAAGVTMIAPPTFASTASERILVLVELSGGNDGLNTVVPYRDPEYRRLRPNLAVPARRLRTLDDSTALHPSLSGLQNVWERGELAIVDGVGYPNPNRSHFRSIEIWESGTAADEYDHRGWIGRVLPDSEVSSRNPAGLILGGDDGPLAGTHALALDDPNTLFRVADRLEQAMPTGDNPALDHVLRTQNDLLDAVEKLKGCLKKAPSFGDKFGRSPAGRALQLAAQMIAAGLPLYAIRTRVGGFDTHVNQAGRHARMLRRLDEGLAAFRDAMKQVGRWDDVLVVTYSEFGRRPHENGGGGTDHGTAAPQLILGGAVKGGRHGARPSLERLDRNGDLIHTTDFRDVYATIANIWWKVPQHDFNDFNVIPFV
jgi:uncharacterized protein (DUF1501 family)